MIAFTHVMGKLEGNCAICVILNKRNTFIFQKSFKRTYKIIQNHFMYIISVIFINNIVICINVVIFIKNMHLQVFNN